MFYFNIDLPVPRLISLLQHFYSEIRFKNTVLLKRFFRCNNNIFPIPFFFAEEQNQFSEEQSRVSVSNFCKSNPCSVNTASCQNCVESFDCICNVGWAGATCAKSYQLFLINNKFIQKFYKSHINSFTKKFHFVIHLFIDPVTRFFISLSTQL